MKTDPAGPPERADIVVVGAGVMGLWTALTLRDRRHDVLLVDSWPPGHPRATSSGETRMIRCGYGESGFYTAWARRSMSLWESWQQRRGETYFHRTGVLWMAGEDPAYAEASLAGLEKHRVAHERLELSELSSRYPWISFDGVPWGLLEPEAGAIQARRACVALARDFTQDGGRILRARVKPGASTASGLVDIVAEEEGELRRIQAGTFLFACGPWLPFLFPDVLAERITVTRKEVFFFGTPPGDDRWSARRMPAWLELDTGCYGIPEIDGRGFKLAPDVPGKAVNPDRMDRRPKPEMLRLARACLRRRFPALTRAPVAESRVCQYSSTADDHLIFDRHPAWENTWLLGAGSGHAFKHGPVIGEMAADVASGAHPADDIPPALRLAHRPEGRNF